MRRVLLLLACVALVAPAAARAEDVTSCGILSCVTADGHIDLGCGADGRDPTACAADATFGFRMTSPLPIESMDTRASVTCSVPCTGERAEDDTCGWAPGEVRPPGETGCELGDVWRVAFTAPALPAGTCATVAVFLDLAARTRLDPIPAVSLTASDELQICG